MKLYLIKHIPSGYYMPEPIGRMGRGGSHTEPDPDPEHVRLFRTKRAATNALVSWLRGKVHASRGKYSGPDFIDEYYEYLTIEKIASRKREDMEVVEKELTL